MSYYSARKKNINLVATLSRSSSRRGVEPFSSWWYFCALWERKKKQLRTSLQEASFGRQGKSFQGRRINIKMWICIHFSFFSFLSLLHLPIPIFFHLCFVFSRCLITDVLYFSPSTSLRHKRQSCNPKNIYNWSPALFLLSPFFVNTILSRTKNKNNQFIQPNPK